MKRSRLRSRRKGPPRRGRLYDVPYRKWIATKPCCVPGCANRNIEACHTKALGKRGMGQKTSDRSCIPLCGSHHWEQDRGMRTKTFEADYRVCIAEQVARLNAEYEALSSSPE